MESAVIVISSETLLQHIPPVLSSWCQLTQVDLHVGCKSCHCSSDNSLTAAGDLCRVRLGRLSPLPLLIALFVDKLIVSALTITESTDPYFRILTH